MSRNQRYGIGAAVTMAAVVLTAAACSAPGASSSTSSSGAASSGTAAAGPIKIAVVDAQSGADSDLGQFESPWGQASPLSRRMLRAGVDGRKIQLTLYDDQADPTVGTELARKIASEGDIAMFGTAEKRRDDRHGTHPRVGEDRQHHLGAVHRAARREEPVPVPERPDRPHLRHHARQVPGHHQGL